MRLIYMAKITAALSPSRRNPEGMTRPFFGASVLIFAMLPFSSQLALARHAR
jgi:hypothetical protein